MSACTACHAEATSAIRAAMRVLVEQMPMGSIGEDGPTRAELDDCIEKTGQPWEGDAAYHAAQLAWRILEDALREREESCRT